MKKGNILHLEDEERWIEHVSNLLGKEYEIYSASTFMGAAEHFANLSAVGTQFDLAIIDIDIVKEGYRDERENMYIEESDYQRGGFDFIQGIQSRGMMEGEQIIILSGHVQDGDNQLNASRKYNVAGTFDKGYFVDDKQEIKELVDRIVSNRE